MKLTATILSLTMTCLAAQGQTGIESPKFATEALDRGVVALNASSKGNFVSWRLLPNDDEEKTRFDVIRNGTTVARNQYKTNYVDASGTTTSKYLRQVILNANPTFYDMKEIAPLLNGMRIISSNINQIAKKANETSNIYAADIEKLREECESLFLILNQSLSILRSTKASPTS